MPVYFHAEDIALPVYLQSVSWKKWLTSLATYYNFKVGVLNYIFCSDDKLLSINQEYLKHDTLTDIITFDNSEEEDILEGDIYISLDRVRENAGKFNVSEKEEAVLVMAHGLLHLCGFSDKTAHEKKEMRACEENALLLAVSAKFSLLP